MRVTTYNAENKELIAARKAIHYAENKKRIVAKRGAIQSQAKPLSDEQ